MRQTYVEAFFRISILFPLMSLYKLIFPFKEKYCCAGLTPKFKNPDGSQMTTKERKIKYGKNWI